MSWRQKLERPAGVALAAVFGLALGWMGIDNNVELEKGRQLAREGIQATAVVLATRESGRKARSYYVSYRYKAAGREVRREAKVDRASYLETDAGMWIPVRFDASDANRSIIGGELARLESWGERFGPFAGAALMVAGFLSRVPPSPPATATRKRRDTPRKSRSPSSGSPRGGPGPRGSARGKRG